MAGAQRGATRAGTPAGGLGVPGTPAAWAEQREELEDTVLALRAEVAQLSEAARWPY